MKKIKVFLLGNPKIYMNDIQYEFPYSRVEALFYYILTVKEESKYKLADLFWGDKYDNEKANKNFRNALYLIRKDFGKDFFITNTKRNLSINPNMDITIDIHELHNDLNILQNHNSLMYLENFFVKDSNMFDDFISEKRIEFSENIFNKIYDDMSSGNDEYKLWEKLCVKLIKLDEFDEKAYKLLIKIYEIQKKYDKALNLYNQLKKTLDCELSIIPSKDITDLMKNILSEQKKHLLTKIDNKKTHNIQNKKLQYEFYGRCKELSIIDNEINKFNTNQECKSVIVSGKFGIGKTRLCNEGLSSNKNSKIVVHKFKCYPNEENFIMILWQIILTRVLKSVDGEILYKNKDLLDKVKDFFYILYGQDDEINNVIFNLNNIDNSNLPIYLIELLVNLESRKKIIIFIDDLQWIDHKSLSILHSIITLDKNKNILFLLTYEKSQNIKIEDFILEMYNDNYMTEIMLNCFSIEDTVQIVENILDMENFDLNLRRKIFAQTHGNPFFIIEISKCIKQKYNADGLTQNIENLIKLKLSKLNSHCKKILELMSLFFEKIEYSFLTEFLKIDEIDLIDSIETLISEDFIYEEERYGKIYLNFIHQPVNSYVYDQISLTKKKLLHDRIGKWFEKIFIEHSDESMLLRIIYHYMRCSNKEKAKEYMVKYFSKYFSISHDFFPILNNYDVAYSTETYYNNVMQIEYILKTIENWVTEQLDSIQLNNYDEEQYNLYLHILSQSYVKKPDYKKSNIYINKMIELNTVDNPNKDNIINLLNAYKQLAYICINKYDIEQLIEIINKSISLANKIKHNSIGVWHRFSGMVLIMKGDIDSGRRIMFEAIKIFEMEKKLEDWKSNIAISYSWIGETYRLAENYDDAYTYYKKSISIIDNTIEISGKPLLYLRLGQYYLDCKNYDEANKYLMLTVNCYENLNLVWLRSIAYCCYAKVRIKYGDYKKAGDLLKKAYEYSYILDSPYEKCMFNKIMYDISSSDLNKYNYKNIILDIIDGDDKHYKKEYVKYKNILRSQYEITYIEKFNILE